MKIYTRTGDEGTTALFGGDRVPKDHPRIAAYGTVDETNSYIGVALAHLSSAPGEDRLAPLLTRLQDDLFVLGADLATPVDAKPVVPRIDGGHITRLEQVIDDFEADLPPLKHFVLPGGTPAGAMLHVARTTCRHAERLAVKAGREAPVNQHAAVYLNRLSDLLFVLARWANHEAGTPESYWSQDKK